MPRLARAVSATQSASYSPRTSPGDGRVPALDGIRGAAIAGVVGFHFLENADSSLAPVRLLLKVIQAGWVGVPLFFVLSGYLITGILLDAMTSPNYYRGFYARRFLRIFPLYYGVLVLFFLVFSRLGVHHGPLGRYAEASDYQAWFWLYAANVLVATRGWPLVGQHFWSLAIEEQFYLAWPLVVRTLGRRHLWMGALACVVAAPACRLAFHLLGMPMWARAMAPCWIDALGCGALLAVTMRGAYDGEALARLCRWCILGAGLASLGLGCWVGSFSGGTPVVYLFGFSFLAVAFTAMVALTVSAAPSPALVWVFNQPVLRFLGRYSYGLYVLHQPILLYFNDLGGPAMVTTAVGGSILVGRVVSAGVLALVTILAALVSWTLLEKPCLALKSRFAYR